MCRPGNRCWKNGGSWPWSGFPAQRLLPGSSCLCLISDVEFSWFGHWIQGKSVNCEDVMDSIPFADLLYYDCLDRLQSCRCCTAWYGGADNGAAGSLRDSGAGLFHDQDQKEQVGTAEKRTRWRKGCGHTWSDGRIWTPVPGFVKMRSGQLRLFCWPPIIFLHIDEHQQRSRESWIKILLDFPIKAIKHRLSD